MRNILFVPVCLGVIGLVIAGTPRNRLPAAKAPLVAVRGSPAAQLERLSLHDRIILLGGAVPDVAVPLNSTSTETTETPHLFIGKNSTSGVMRPGGRCRRRAGYDGTS